MGPQAMGERTGLLPDARTCLGQGPPLILHWPACLPVHIPATSPWAGLLTPVAAPSSLLQEGTQGCHGALLTGETEAILQVSRVAERDQVSLPLPLPAEGRGIITDY